jgi:hypothetical protein
MDAACRLYALREALSFDVACDVFKAQTRAGNRGVLSEELLFRLCSQLALLLMQHVQCLRNDGARSVHVVFDGRRSALKLVRADDDGRLAHTHQHTSTRSHSFSRTRSLSARALSLSLSLSLSHAHTHTPPVVACFPHSRQPPSCSVPALSTRGRRNGRKRTDAATLHATARDEREWGVCACACRLYVAAVLVHPRLG